MKQSFHYGDEIAVQIHTPEFIRQACVVKISSGRVSPHFGQVNSRDIVILQPGKKPFGKQFAYLAIIQDLGEDTRTGTGEKLKHTSVHAGI